MRGEVAVQQNGHTHAVSAPGLDGAIEVDLDHGSPGTVITVTDDDVGVVYGDDADVEAPSDELATDGGHVSRTEVEMRGFGIGEDASIAAMLFGSFTLAASGYVWALDFPGHAFVALFAFLASAAIGYIGARSYGGGARA